MDKQVRRLRTVDDLNEAVETGWRAAESLMKMKSVVVPVDLVVGLLEVLSLAGLMSSIGRKRARDEDEEKAMSELSDLLVSRLLDLEDAILFHFEVLQGTMGDGHDS